MSKQITGIVGWLKDWFYDETEIDGFITTLNNSIGSKLNANLTEANKNVVTDGSGNVVLENKPVIPDVSGKIDTAGTGLSKSGTTLNHSNSVTAQTSAVAKKIKYDGQGHITGTSALYGSDIAVSSSDSTKINTALGNKANSVHTHSINDITSLQSELDDLDGRIDDLESIKAIEVVSSLPTASADTMNRLYIVSENSKINVYYTVTDGQLFEWHKMDADILDELSIAWNDITGKPSTFTPSSHSHSINDVNNLQTTLNGKAPTNHSSSATTYGVGTSANYGHNKVINNLTTSTHSDGNSLSAYQGYVLKGLIDDLDDAIASFDASDIDFDPSSNIWGEYVQVVSNVAQGLDTLKMITNSLNTSLIGKQDEITSIALVDKAINSGGKIIFYTGDEPT